MHLLHLSRINIYLPSVGVVCLWRRSIVKMLLQKDLKWTLIQANMILISQEQQNVHVHIDMFVSVIEIHIVISYICDYV